jgi:outer membrane protein OmpA-like peptidoglycan-associated protein
MKTSCFIALLFIIQFTTILAQPAKFAPFEGTIYDLYDYNTSKGYTPAVLKFDVLGKTTLPELNVKRNIKYFPGVYQQDGYGIIFTSTLTVDTDGCYDFLLESDDGSILWIEDRVVIDNDSMHQMRAMRDTLSMKAGRYPVKVWFYNGATQWHGLILKVNKVPDSIPCPQDKRQFVLNDILFDVNSHLLNSSGQQELDKFIRFLNATIVHKLRVVGHTDNTGTAEYNKRLSLKRAESVAAYIKSKLNLSIAVEAIGMGYDMPLTKDVDAESQQRNRRVEISIE